MIGFGKVIQPHRSPCEAVQGLYLIRRVSHSGTTCQSGECCTHWISLLGPLCQAALCNIQPVLPHKATLRQLSDPSGKKSDHLSEVEGIKDRVNQLHQTSSAPSCRAFKVTGIQTTCLWLQSSNLLLKEVISVFQSLVFLTTGCFLPIVSPCSSTCRMCPQRMGWIMGWESFESQPGGNLKTKGLQADIICSLGLSSCWG